MLMYPNDLPSADIDAGKCCCHFMRSSVAQLSVGLGFGIAEKSFGMKSLHFGKLTPRLCFYQTGLAWSVDQGSNKNHSPAYNFAPTVTKFCVMWEGLSLPHDTKFGNCRCKIVDSRVFPSWSLIHGLRWSGLIKAEPGIDAHAYYCPSVRSSGHLGLGLSGFWSRLGKRRAVVITGGGVAVAIRNDGGGYLLSSVLAAHSSFLLVIVYKIFFMRYWVVVGGVVWVG